METRRHAALEGLQPRRTIYMRDRREPGSPLGPHGKDTGHESRETRPTGRQLEIPVRSLDRHNRRERPEFLAVFDVAVEPVAHFGRVRRGEDAAVPERARSEFQSAIHPPDDAAGDEIVGDPIDQFRVVQFVPGLTILTRQLRQRGLLHRRSPERMVGDLAIRIAEVNAVGIQSGAQCTAGISGGWRNEEPLETRFGEDPCIGDTVQRYAAAHAQIGQTRFLTKRPGDFHQRVLQHPLHARGAVRKPPAFRGLQIKGLVRAAGRAEQINEPR